MQSGSAHVFIAMSLDGFIAKENDSIDFLDTVALEGEDYGFAAFSNSVDAVLMGRRTYDKVCEMGVPDPFPGKELWICSSQEIHTSFSHIHWAKNGPIQTLQDLIAQGKQVYVDGGQIIRLAMQHNLIRSLTISVIPQILGKGIKLFGDELPWIPLELLQSEAYQTGLVQLKYRIGKAD